ncbi:hypothetical protein M9Y10_030282 [Tritrichomonas musculus]|uniref:Uncharacterized protein n=1 Tax=Tritrichomonas musculus TaxID=1915356 RepID=A0ABR2KPG0_9EUKA
MLRNDEKISLLPMKPFDEIIIGPISGPILQVIDDSGFSQLIKIQIQAIPILNEQKPDHIAQAQIGSGLGNLTFGLVSSKMISSKYFQKKLQQKTTKMILLLLKNQM